MFIPSMGLFSILHHSRAEQIPFKIRLEYAKKFTIKQDDKLTLFGLNQTIFWPELDRWDYTDSLNPSPPHYNNYTLWSLKQTFIMLFLLTFVQFIAIFVLKTLNSVDFREELQWTNKFIHVLENLNYASPFRDWDHGKYKIKEFKERRKGLKKEMTTIFMVNIIMTMIMMIPIWYCGKQCNIHNFKGSNYFNLVLKIEERHTFLLKLVKPKATEVSSYNNAIISSIVVTIGVLGFCLLEVVTYFIYAYKV